MKISDEECYALNLTLAEAVYGWTPRYSPDVGGYWMVPEGDPHRDAFGTADCVPDYVGNRETALSILDRWEGDADLRRTNGYWRVELFVPSMQWAGIGGTLEVAICRARLAAAGVTLSVVAGTKAAPII